MQIPTAVPSHNPATKSTEIHGGGGGWGGLGNGAGVPLPDLFIPAGNSVGSRHLTTKPDTSHIQWKIQMSSSLFSGAALPTRELLFLSCHHAILHSMPAAY